MIQETPDNATINYGIPNSWQLVNMSDDVYVKKWELTDLLSRIETLENKMQ